MWENGPFVWTRNESHCEESLLRGGETEVFQSSFGANDFVIGVLMELGLWDAMTSMYPNRLKDENGYNWRTLNGVEILRCLLKEGRISGTNKVLSDARLVGACGFNLQEQKIASKLQEGKPVIDSETLGNHLARIDGESCLYTFFEHIKLLRQKKWIRGKVFAADGHDITVPYGRDYDGMGKRGEAYGYKLEGLLSVEEKRELFVGFGFGPIQSGERTMLQEIFERYEERVGPIREMIEILLLDRGYWGVKFFEKLLNCYHIDFVTMTRDPGLDIVKQIFGFIEHDKRATVKQRYFNWKWHREDRPPSKEYPKGEIRELLVAGIDGVGIEDDEGNALDVNVVVVYEHDEKRQPLKDPDDESRQLISIYVTSLPAEKSPMKIRKLYRKRWTIENQGFRAANQEWGIDDLGSRVSMDAMRADIAFRLMLYNAEKIIRMKFPGPWQKEKDNLKNLGRDELLGGPAIIVYTNDGHLGIFTIKCFQEIISAAVQTQERARLKAMLLRTLKGDQKLEDIICQLDTT